MKYVTLAIRTQSGMAAEFELARKSLGFPSRAAYVWFLHLARKGADNMASGELDVLLELGHHGNFKFNEITPSTDRMGQFVRRSIDDVEKILESLEMKTFVAVMPTPIVGNFANDVVSRNGRRYRLTPMGAEALRALGRTPKLAGGA